MRAAASALPSLAALLCVAANAADAPLLDCVEPIARTFHVRIVDTSGGAAAITCVPLQPRSTLEQAMDRLLQPSGLAWRRLDDGTLEIIGAAPSRVKLPALDIEGDPVVQVERPDSALATALVERASAATSLDRRWLDTAPLLGFNQLGWYAPNVYGAGQSLAIRGIERDTDYFPALTVTFDGIELGTRLLDDELVPLEDVTNLNLARGPRTFESGEGAQAGAISLKTAAPAAESITSIALGIGNMGARNGAIAWSGPLSASGLAATIALDEHELPSFVRQRAVPEANVEKRRNDFGRVKLSYAPDSGLSAQLAALALSGDSSDRQVVAPTPGFGQPAPGAFDPFERDSDASNPTVAQTHARGAAGFVRYDQRDRWAVDAHASITKISRDLTEFPRGTQWSDYELRRRLGVTASEHPTPDWTILAALDHDYIATRFATPLSSGQLYFNYFAAATDSASVWIEHSWNPVWKTGLGVRWSHERTTEFDAKDLWHAYQVPIPLAAVEWSPGTDHVFTLSYGTGYRSGGQIYTGIITFDPERSQNLELAWRAQWLGGALHTTLFAFDGEIHNRYTYYLSSPAGDPLLASVRSRGLEFELDANVSEQWQLRAGIGVLDSRFSSFVYRHGDPTSEAPPHTATLGARYGRANGWYAAADAYHAAAARYYNPAGRLPAFGVLSFRIGYRAARCDTALIATNALDAEYVERIQLSPGNESGYRLGDPRRIELRVKWSW